MIKSFKVAKASFYDACCSNRRKKPRPDIQVLDEWEILPQRIQRLEELGEGAFGKVHKAILDEETSIQGTQRQRQKERIVAVKIIHGGLVFSNRLPLASDHNL